MSFGRNGFHPTHHPNSSPRTTSEPQALPNPPPQPKLTVPQGPSTPQSSHHLTNRGSGSEASGPVRSSYVSQVADLTESDVVGIVSKLSLTSRPRGCFILSTLRTVSCALLMSIAATSGAIAESGQERPSYSDFLGDSTAAGTDDLSAELAALKDEPLGAMNPVSPLQQSIQTDLPINPPVSPSSGTGVAIARRISNVSAGRKSEVWCNVEPSSWSGSGSSGSSAYLYGQAGKAILAYPFRSSGQTNGAYSGAEAKASHNGTQGTQQYQAWGRLEWKISLEGFPFGSYLVYFWNPIFRTQGATVSRSGRFFSSRHLHGQREICDLFVHRIE